MTAQRLVGEYEFVAADIVELYAVAYFKLLFYPREGQHWGQNPPNSAILDGVRRNERMSEIMSMIYNSGINPGARNQPSEDSYAELQQRLEVNIRAENFHRATIDAEQHPVKLIQSEICSSYEEVLRQLLSAFRRTMYYRDMQMIMRAFYFRIVDEEDFDQYMELIFRRIVKKIRQKEEDYSTEAQYWMHFKHGRQKLSNLPPDVQRFVWGQVRREADQGSRPWNTYHDNVY